MKKFKNLEIASKIFQGFIFYTWWGCEIKILISHKDKLITLYDYHIFSDGRSPEYEFEKKYFLYEFI